MMRVRVDFSTTARNGMIRANLTRLEPSDASVGVGDRIEAFDPDDDLTFTGVVEAIEDQFAYLRMEWRQAVNPVPVNEAGENIFVTFSEKFAPAVGHLRSTSIEDRGAATRMPPAAARLTAPLPVPA